MAEMFLGGRRWDVKLGEGDGPWYVASHPTGMEWYIVNVETGRFKRVGKVRLSGTNYYDKASEMVATRNKNVAERRTFEAALKELQKIDLHLAVDIEAAVLCEDITREEGAARIARALAEARRAEPQT